MMVQACPCGLMVRSVAVAYIRGHQLGQRWANSDLLFFRTSFQYPGHISDQEKSGSTLNFLGIVLHKMDL